MEKINIAELLKDCPNGMELDCTNYDGIVKFDGFNKNNPYTIRISVMYDGVITIHNLTKYGQTSVSSYNKCVIFPKGKTTWEGFHKPFKDGDIVATKHGLFIGIVKVKNNIQLNAYCAIDEHGSFAKNINYGFERFATEEEKEKLFQAIKDNGYKWDEETKTLEKLVKPKFKIGDRIRHKNDKTIIKTINYIYNHNDSYGLWDGHLLFFNEQDNYELAPNKFDIMTLIPFESRVLVRNVDEDLWKPALYGFSPSKGGCYVVGGTYWKQCIPYEANKELLGTNNNPE